MKSYQLLTKEEREAERSALLLQYEEEKKKGYKLDMSRGKPAPDQLDLSMDMLSQDPKTLIHTRKGTDVRNYGELAGVDEAKELFAEVLGLKMENIIMGGQSSLALMYDCIVRAWIFGVYGGSKPWSQQGTVKFLCPVPGYDRHFRITEYFGIENVPVPMLPTGPDMDIVEKLVAEDESIKGIWCVPKYSNPTGNSYSDETVMRMARLKPAAKDFRIYWDNAYTVHHLYDFDQDRVVEMLAECKRAGNPDLVYKFASTSKISFPGSGIAALAASLNNLEDIRGQLKVQTIGHDKVNQLRHVRFFGNIHGMVEHMKKHADILRPKFEAVEEIFSQELGGLGIADWTSPKGGYFISFNTMEGCAKEVVSKCAKAGVTLTSAGATWPGGKDPKDSNIRVAPSFPPLEDLKTAAKVLALCTKLAAVQKLLEGRKEEQEA